LNEENQAEQKRKVKSKLLQDMQETLLVKEINRLKKSASIEIINPLFQNSKSS